MEPVERIQSGLMKLIRGPVGAPLLGVWFAIALHLLWAGLLLGSSAPRQTTGIWALSQLFPNRYGLALILLTVAACALGGLFREPSTGKILLLVPQQIVLGISAAGAVRAMVLGEFADGVQRHHAFLIADQAPVVLALLVHSMTILFLAYLVIDKEEREWASK